ncbi:MAG: Crp/Fnr family transcriptional regulator [Aquamicrobium sp.]|uniref:Crp/Fnr family transcriptional regulator n=1 Tax=Aquamicrobium sp. TaxID=1872579 RepID=UPI00349EF909|nr:Crp/Fnr family transcriptional regulator [Aquamicrobium sp.]
MTIHDTRLAHEPIVPWIVFRDQSCWDAVLHLGRKVAWRAGAVIQRPEDEVAGIFLLRSGTIKVAAASAGGLQRTLWLMGEGSVLGEAALFGRHPYMHEIVALEDCTAVEFPRAVVMDALLAHHPEVSAALLSNMAAKCYIMSTQVEDTTFLSAAQRLGRFLYGVCLTRGTRHVRLSHATIADLLGLHRVTVSNTVSALRRAGLIEDRTHDIVVADMARLAAFTGQAAPPA